MSGTAGASQLLTEAIGGSGMAAAAQLLVEVICTPPPLRPLVAAERRFPLGYANFPPIAGHIGSVLKL